MHCSACVLLTERELGAVEGVSQVTANLRRNRIEVEGDFGDRSREDIRRQLSAAIERYGYRLSETEEEPASSAADFSWAALIALAAIAIFLGLQKLGIANLITASTVGFGTAFAIGLVASVSSCMAVVGGLVLSLSATYAKAGKIRAHVMFHLGRIIAFFLLGGLLGAAGAFLHLSAVATTILGLGVAVIMVILGLNLLDIPFFRRFQLTMPQSIGKRAFGFASSTAAPLLIGAVTFFLPCGFTQSMQLYALTTHDFFTAAGLMLSFALGTLPVLGLLSIGSSVAERLQKHSGIAFKAMGIIVLFFALFNILNSLAALGVLPPLFNL